MNDDATFERLVDAVLARDGALCFVRAPGCLVIATTITRADGPRSRGVAACEACAEPRSNAPLDGADFAP